MSSEVQADMADLNEAINDYSAAYQGPEKYAKRQAILALVRTMLEDKEQAVRAQWAAEVESWKAQCSEHIDHACTYLAERDSAQAEAKALREALATAVEALADGLWDYGPGQDEHDKCEEVLAFCRAALQPGASSHDE